MSESPSVLIVADWSATTRGRAVWRSDVQERSVERLSPPAGGWTLPRVLHGVAGGNGGTLVAFDAPLGLPRSFLAAAGMPRFLDWLEHACDGDALDPVASPTPWTVARPFIVPRGTGSWKLAVAEALGVGVELLRDIDRETNAECVFKLVGAKQVGGAARALWRELVAARREGVDFSIWPFETADLGGGVIVAEIYPSAAYRIALDRPLGAKSDPVVRRAAVADLEKAGWALRERVRFADLTAAGDSDHDLDALLTVAALLRLQLEGRSLASPQFVDPVSEGGILCV